MSDNGAESALPAPPPAEQASLARNATLPALLVERARTSPGEVAIRAKELGRWRPVTWGQVVSHVTRVAAGLHALGVRAGDRVAVLSTNRPEWVFADIGAQAIGAVSVGIDPSGTADQVGVLLRHCGAVVAVVEDEEQLDKVEEVRAGLPALRDLVLVDTRGVHVGGREHLVSMGDLEELGSNATVSWLAEAVDALDPSRAAIIAYTSGATGTPKGAMLSQVNLLAAARSSCTALGLTSQDEILSFLPLARTPERLLSVVDAIAVGCTVNFGEGGEQFPAELREVAPTVFFGIPLVWQKLMDGVEARVANASRLKRTAWRAARSLGTPVARRRRQGAWGVGEKLVYLVAWVLALGAVRRKLGLWRVRVALSGSAPIDDAVTSWFWALGVPVRDTYVLTESTGIAAVLPVDDVREGSVGPACPGVEIRVAADGELLTRCTGVFLGYFGDREATAAALDRDGWLHTGDLGRVDLDGFVTVTGRTTQPARAAAVDDPAPPAVEGAAR